MKTKWDEQEFLGTEEGNFAKKNWQKTTNDFFNHWGVVFHLFTKNQTTPPTAKMAV